MSAQLKILGVHGLGDHRDDTWIDQWTDTVVGCVRRFDFEGSVIDRAVNYDDYFFDHVDFDPAEYLAAAQDLVGSWISTTFSDWFRRVERPAALWDTLSYEVQRTAGYVVAWLRDAAFRAETHRLLVEAIEEFEPDVLLAHSLGSLISYDTLWQMARNGASRRR
ncbi:MAG: hypothetical protein R3C10_10420 [Pirellulales bacterium]